jgi:hypothetical protein
MGLEATMQRLLIARSVLSFLAALAIELAVPSRTEPA